MRLPSASTVFAILSWISAVAATGPLGTVIPCPGCPASIRPPPITVTAQYQEVSTCVPVKGVASCKTYDWVSTRIPCEGGTKTTLITKTDQIVTLGHVSTVLDKPKHETYVVDITAPYKDCGPAALPPWEGSGLCKNCKNNNGDDVQPVHVSKCDNKVCTTYKESWVSRKPTVASRVSTGVVSTTAYLSNGRHTVPMTTTFPPPPGYDDPVTKTVYHTTTITDGPRHVTCTNTVTITFTHTVTHCPETICSGTTKTVCTHTTGPQSQSATTTPTITQRPTTTTPTITQRPTSSTSLPTYIPTSPNFEFVGCMGSRNGFKDFQLEDTSRKQRVERCTSECLASGYKYCGLHSRQCYCAMDINHEFTSESHANGKCDIPCPGNKKEACGGTAKNSRGASGKYLKPAARVGQLFDVYALNQPTSTSSSVASDTSDSSPMFTKRAIEERGPDADITAASPRITHDAAVRRGGLVRNAKALPTPVIAKRDFGIPQLFGN